MPLIATLQKVQSKYDKGRVSIRVNIILKKGKKQAWLHFFEQAAERYIVEGLSSIILIDKKKNKQMKKTEKNQKNDKMWLKRHDGGA